MDEKAFEVPDDAADLAEEIRENERSLSASALVEARRIRLEQLREVLAVFGLSVGASNLDPPPPPDDPPAGRVRVRDEPTTKDPELASLLGLALGILDTITDQGGAGVAAAYEGLVRELISAPSVAERELMWWRCLHNRALLTYGLTRLDPPSDLAPRSEAVIAIDAMVWAAARALHGATTVRLLLETPPDAMYGGAAARNEALTKGIEVARSGAEHLDEVLAVVDARGELFD